MRYIAQSNVIFGNVNLRDYDAFAFYCNIFDKPERDVSVVSVAGRNGDLIFDNGRYKNVDRKYIVQVQGIQNANRLLADLINERGYQDLKDEYDTGHYYTARLKSLPRITGFVGDAVKMEILFSRYPQMWIGNDEPIVLVDEVARSGDQSYGWMLIPNPTNQESFPKIEIETDGLFLSVSIVGVKKNGNSYVDDKSCGNIRLVDFMLEEDILVDCENHYVLDKNNNASWADHVENAGSFGDDFEWGKIASGEVISGFRVNANFGEESGGHIKVTVYPRWWEL